MKKLILFAAVIGMFTACDEDKNNDNPTGGTPAGVADVTLTMTGDAGTYELDGPCGWAFAGGVGYIGANQANNSLKTFSIDTNLTALPTETTTYTLTDDPLDEAPNKIRVHLTEFTGGSSFISWDSTPASGQLTLEVNGNEVTANLNGINLIAETTNAAPYNHNGTLSGTIKIYR